MRIGGARSSTISPRPLSNGYRRAFWTESLCCADIIALVLSRPQNAVREQVAESFVACRPNTAKRRTLVVMSLRFGDWPILLCLPHFRDFR